jgi:hypothetical protein
MFKKLLHLYNDGHNPFPHMKGNGMIEYFDPDRPGWSEFRYVPDDTTTKENDDVLLRELEMLSQKQINDINDAYIEKQIKETGVFPESNIPTVQTKEESKFEKEVEAYEKEKNTSIEEYYDELDDINFDIDKLKHDENKLLKSSSGSMSSIDEFKRMLDTAEKLEREKKKEIITNNLEKVKLANEIVTKTYEMSESYFKVIHKKGKDYFLLVKKQNDIFVNDVLETETLISDNELLQYIMEYSKKTGIKLNDALPTLFAYINGVVKDGIISNKAEIKLLQNAGESILRLLHKKLYAKVSELDDKNEKNNKYIDDLKLKKIALKERIVTLEAISSNIKDKQKDYSIIKSKYDTIDRAKEERVLKQLQEYKRRIDIQPEITTKEATEIKELLLEVKKIKKDKPIKKSEDEKQEDITKANVSGRLDHIENKISPYGKDLESYLASDNGSIILKYITKDNSKVYDNEYNKNIPDIQVTLNNGKTESLRKATTLDLYNDKNVFEIKNYKQYSITDDIIPLQETKLEGTYYFKPLYLKNGNLYNIELTYSDDSGEHKKYILPENNNGRELVLIYRLKDGLYQYKPLIGKDVTLQHTTNTTSDGKQSLYVFKRAKYDNCTDHHGNPSFNIKPYLTKIKI